MLILTIISSVISVTHGIRWANVSRLQFSYDSQCSLTKTCQQGLYYDKSYIDGPFSDKEAAKILLDGLKKACNEACM